MFYRVDVPNGFGGYTTHRMYVRNLGRNLAQAWADAGTDGRVYQSPTTLGWVEVAREG